MIVDSGKMGLDWWGPVQSHPRPHRSWSRKPLVSDWGWSSGFLTSWFWPPWWYHRTSDERVNKRWQKKRIVISSCRRRRRSWPKRLNRRHSGVAIKGGGRHLNTMECLAAAKSPSFGTNWISRFLSVPRAARQSRNNRLANALLQKNRRQNKQNSVSIEPQHLD